MPPRRRPQSARLTPRSAARDDARDDEESWKRELRLALQGEMSAEPGSLDDLKRSQPKPEAFRVALTSPRSVVACLLAGVDPNTLVPREIPPSALPHPDRAYENRERENRERRRRALNDVRLRQLLARRSSLSDADVARHRRLLCGEDARDAAAAARRVERAAKMAAEDAETLEAVRQAERVARLAADELLEFAAAENRADVETMGAALADRRAEAEERGSRVTSGEKREKKTETETAPGCEAPRTSPPPSTSPSPPRTSPSPPRTSASPPRTTPPPPRTPARLVANAFASDASAEPAVSASPMGDSLERASRRRADAFAELERVERRAARSSAERRVSSRLFRAETRAEREKANASIAESSARVDAAETAVLSALDDAPRMTPREELESASADGVIATPVASPRRAGASALFSPGSPFATRATPDPNATSVGHVRPSPRPRSAFASDRDRAAAKAHRETMRASLRAVESAERDAFETAANALVESKITSARETRAAAEAHRRAERVAAKTRRAEAAARRLELARERRDAEAEASAAAAEARVAAADVRRSIIDAEFADALERRAAAEANAQTRAAMARERRAAEEAERRAAIAKRLAARCAAAAAKVEAKFAAASDAARRAAEDAERNRAMNARAISGKEAERAAKVEERLRETEMKAAAARARREAATRRLTFAEPTTRRGAGGAFDGTLPETPEFQRRRAGIEGPGCVPVELVVSPGGY